MKNIMRKVGVFDFLFGMFIFDNHVEIDEAILNYDAVNMELRIFGMRVYLNPNLVSQETKNPHKGGEFFGSWKTPKMEKN